MAYQSFGFNAKRPSTRDMDGKKLVVVVNGFLPNSSVNLTFPFRYLDLLMGSAFDLQTYFYVIFLSYPIFL